VVLPSKQRNYGPQISALPGVNVREHPELTIAAFKDAGVETARALAVVWQDDVGNFHAGLRAQELNPGLRLVLAIYNRRLGDHIRLLFPDCTVLSGTAMSAPSFVAAALGAPAPSHVRVQRRTLYVARQSDVAADHVICGLVTPAEESPRLVAPDAQLSVMEIKWGLIPDMTGSQLLPELVGRDVAKELTYTGRVLGGREAAGLGLATRVSADPLGDALTLATEIAAKSPQAIRAAKHLLDLAGRVSLRDGFAAEQRVIRQLIGSPDQTEAVRANLEGRSPVFTGD